jgi:hypothetical protein
VTTRSLLAAAAVGSIIVTGCSTRTAGQIPVQRPATVPPHAATVAGPAISGVVRDTLGRPVAGATVLVEVEQSGAEQAVNVMKALSSVGVFCAIGSGCTPPRDSGFSARDGSFAVAVPKNNPGHDAYSLTVAVARSRTARVATSVSLSRSARHGMTVGAVVIAAGTPAVVTRGHRSHVIPPPLPAKYRAGQFAAFLNTETGTPPVIAGSQLTVTSGYLPRVEEDERLLLTTTQSGVQRGRQALFSSSLETRNARLVPPSRGASCYVEGSRGQRIEQHPCGLTDGALDLDWLPRDDPRCSRGPCPGQRQRDHRDVTVVLPRAMRARLLVVRGCINCLAMTSGDGRHFVLAGREPFGAADDILVQPLNGRTVRAVRIQTDTGGFFTSLREVSVWASP